MHTKNSLRIPVAVTLIAALAGCQTLSNASTGTDQTIEKPRFEAQSGRTVVYMKPDNFTAASYIEDVDRCRESAANMAKGYNPPSSTTHGGGYYGGGGLLGALIAGIAVGVTKGIVSAAQRQEYENEKFEDCMTKDYQQVHLPKSFVWDYEAAGDDPEKQGQVLAELVSSDEFAEFAAWQRAVEKSDKAAYQAHADRYPDSLFGDLAIRYVAYQEQIAEKLVSIRTDSYLRNNYFFTYGLASDGWVETIGPNGVATTDCTVRKWGKMKVRVRDGWIQGSLYVHVENTGAADEIVTHSVVGHVKQNGKFDIVADWPKEDPLILSGDFSGNDALDGHLIRADRAKACEYGFVRLNQPMPTDDEKSTWLDESELPIEELAEKARERLGILAREVAANE